jgi:predicted ester cyclase
MDFGSVGHITASSSNGVAVVLKVVHFLGKGQRLIEAGARWFWFTVFPGRDSLFHDRCQRIGQALVRGLEQGAGIATRRLSVQDYTTITILCSDHLTSGGMAAASIGGKECGTMSAENNKAFIRRYFGALSGKDKPRAIQDQYIADSDEVLKNHMIAFEASFPHYELIADDMVAEGDQVAVRTTFKGTHKGEFFGVASTGKDVTMPIMLIYRTAGDKIADHWMVADLVGLMQKLGAVPT